MKSNPDVCCHWIGDESCSSEINARKSKNIDFILCDDHNSNSLFCGEVCHPQIPSSVIIIDFFMPIKFNFVLRHRNDKVESTIIISKLLSTINVVKYDYASTLSKAKIACIPVKKCVILFSDAEWRTYKYISLCE